MADKKNLHRKPTPAELDANIEAALKEIEVETTPETKVEPPIKIVKEEPVQVETVTETPAETETPTETETKEETKEEPKEEPEVKEEPEDHDWKKRYSDSTREAHRIAEKNRKLNAGILEAGDLAEPTDEEMVKEIPDWEILDDFSKRLAKDNILNRRRLEVIHLAAKEGEKVDKWNESVDKFITDPQTLTNNPELEGKVEEFKIFASDPQYNNAPFNLLVGAFLHSQKTAPKPKGSMLETGSGGPNDKPVVKSDVLSVEEGRSLMLTDYKRWKELLQAGKIANQ